GRRLSSVGERADPGSEDGGDQHVAEQGVGKLQQGVVTRRSSRPRSCSTDDRPRRWCAPEHWSTRRDSSDGGRTTPPRSCSPRANECRAAMQRNTTLVPLHYKAVRG